MAKEYETFMAKEYKTLMAEKYETFPSCLKPVGVAAPGTTSPCPPWGAAGAVSRLLLDNTARSTIIFFFFARKDLRKKHGAGRKTEGARVAVGWRGGLGLKARSRDGEGAHSSRFYVTDLM